MTPFLNIYICVFGKRNYRVLSLYVFPCLCVFVCVCGAYMITQKEINLAILKLEYIVVYENNSSFRRVPYWALSDQGQGHGATLKFFSIYHNTNCQVP